MLCLSYYCLCLLFNKIRDKSRTGPAWKRGGVGERGKWHGAGGEMNNKRNTKNKKKISVMRLINCGEFNVQCGKYNQ
jgi:hypothetical protein